MSILYLFLSYAAVFVLGLFAASQFKFGEVIDLYRWIITIVLFTLFGVLSEVESNK